MINKVQNSQTPENKVKSLQTLEDFKRETYSDTVTVVDFYADWCGPCNVIAPVFESLAQKTKNVNFFKLNIEEGDGPEIVQQNRITSLPTFIIFQNGQQIGRYNSILEVERSINQALN